MRSHLIPFLCAPLLLCACPPPESLPDAGTENQAPELSSVTPATGLQSGGTQVTVRGSNFLAGARVWFGGAEGTEVAVVNRAQLTVLTPASTTTGAVDVKIANADGQTHVLPGGYTYEKMPDRTILQALLLNPALRRDATGSAMVPATVTADVEVPGSTEGRGQGPGVRAQVGYRLAPLDPASMAGVAWTDAAYLRDVEGTRLGELARDRYEAQVNLPGATSDEVKDYVLAIRFSIDSGATWVLADRDGSANGATADQLPHVTVARASVDWCKLGGEVVDLPPSLALRLGQAGPVVTAQAWKGGATSVAGKAPGISGQLGYGPVNSQPSAQGWTWVDASYSRDSAGGANDEYTATLPNPGAGVFAFAFRFSLNGGPFLYCDADGSDGAGFTPDQAGKVTVTQPDVDACKLVPPVSYLAQPGAPSPLLAARVLATTVTDKSGQGAGLTGELGYGPVGSMPGAGWTWVSAAYAADADDARADEYRQRAPALGAGDYDVAYRFRYQGKTDVYCDLDGSANGYSPAQAFKLKVANASISACRVNALASSTMASGAKLSVFGQVKVTGITEASGPGAGVRGQVGLGAAGTNASLGGWAWREAIFVGDVSGEDQLRGDLQPAYTGARAVSFRFSLNNGETWTYCDLNGSNVGGYEATQQPALTVGNHADLDACSLQAPATVTSRATDLLGRFTEPGLTDAAGEPADAIVELGYGPKGEDPGVSPAWTWLAAQYSGQSGTSDDFKARLTPAPAGSHDLAFRFARGPAAPYCYGDVDGSANGFTPGTLGAATLP